MPEGPELFLSSKFVNFICQNRTFSGKVLKSEVSKNPEIPWDCEAYKISAISRGKEVKFHLVQESTKDEENDTKSKSKRHKLNETETESACHCDCECGTTSCLSIVFRFGMSGQFQFTGESEVHKHAHLKFYTNDKPSKVLSFVDQRRFGRWDVGADWSKDRGPCVLLEYQAFRENVLKHISQPAFKKPICEVLLNQKYFNGIGNYLRAEILHRASIPPFTSAYTVLEELQNADHTKVKVKQEKCDFLQLCTTLPMEVISLGSTSYSAGSVDREDDISTDDHTAFIHWLRCYYKPHMTNMLDHNRRTIWFSGPAGPLVPNESEGRAKKKAAKSNKNKPNMTSPDHKMTLPDPKMTSPEPRMTSPEPKTTSPEPRTELPKPKRVKKEHKVAVDTASDGKATSSFKVKPTLPASLAATSMVKHAPQITHVQNTSTVKQEPLVTHVQSTSTVKQEPQVTHVQSIFMVKQEAPVTHVRRSTRVTRQSLREQSTN